jgi:uncharacterized protein RhaS with RHS repeats
MMTCCTTSNTAKGESSGTTGMFGRLGGAVSEMNAAKAMGTRVGTSQEPSTGSALKQGQRPQKGSEQRTDPRQDRCFVEAHRGVEFLQADVTVFR